MDNEILIKLNVESSSASQKIKSLNSYLKQLDSQLKLGATGFQNYDQKLKSMSKSVDLTQQKLDGLKTKLNVQNQQLDKASTRYKKLQTELNNLATTLGKNSQEYQDLAQKVAQAQRTEQKYQTNVNKTTAEIQKESQALIELKANLASLPFENLSAGLQKLSGGFGKIGEMTKPLSLALTGAFGSAIKTTIDFESAMAEVGAITNATTSDMEQLETQARKIGETTQLSASQGAESLKLLAQAGYNVSDSIKLSTDTVNLAIASNLELSEATTILVSTLKGFQLGVEESTRVTDVLSKTANSSNTNVSELGSAMTKVAPTAQAMGYKIEDVSVVLGLLANNAIVGEEAGNGLKSMLASLAKPTDNAKGLLDKLGVSLVDTNGNSRSLIDVFKDLRNGFAQLDETQQAEYAATIVGKEQMSKFLAIVNSGEDDFDGLIKAISECDGTTARMRETMEQTTSGSIKSMLSKLQEMGISIGEKLLPHVVKFVEGISKLVDKFNSLDSATQDNIIKLGLFAMGISPVSSGLSKLFDGGSKLCDMLGKSASWLSKNTTESKQLASAFQETSGTTSTLTTKFADFVSASGGLSGSIEALTMSLGGWLTGGVVAVGVGLTIAGLITGFKNLKEQQNQTAESFDYGSTLIKESNKLIYDDLKEKYPEMKKNIIDFKNEGVSELITAFSGASSEIEPDLTAFKNMCETKLQEAQTGIVEAGKNLTQGLSFLNTDVATIFSTDTLAEIQSKYTSRLSEGLNESYETLMSTISGKDEIIEGLMQEHGVDYATAYRTWEEQVVQEYNAFCDELIKVQTEHQADSIDALEKYLQENAIKDKKSYEESQKVIRDGFTDKQNEITSGYQQCLMAVERGELEIEGVTFSSGEQAMKYADLVRDYKINSAQIEKTEQLNIASAIALEQGIISEQEYNDTVEKNNKIIESYSNRNTGLQKIMESAKEDIGGAWEKVWETINNAEEIGIPKSISNNETFVNTLAEYYNSGGTNMSEALVKAYDAMSEASGHMVENSELDFSRLGDVATTQLNNVLTQADEYGWDLETICNKVNSSLSASGSTFQFTTDDIIGYLKYLAENANVSFSDVETAVTDGAETYNESTNSICTDTDTLNSQEITLGTNYRQDMENITIGTDTGKTALETFDTAMSTTTNNGKTESSALQQALVGDFGLINGAVIGTAGVFGTNFGTMNNNVKVLGNQTTSTTGEILTNNTKLNKSSSETATSFNKNLSSMGTQSSNTARTTSTNANTIKNSMSTISTSGNDMQTNTTRAFNAYSQGISGASNTTSSKSGDIKGSLGSIQSQANTSMSGAVGSFNSMKSGITSTASTVSTQSNTMVSSIGKIKGKNEKVTVKFLETGFQSIIGKINSAVNAARNAIVNIGKDSSLFTSEIRPITNIASFSTEGNYFPSHLRTGLKDFDATLPKTLSLKSFKDTSISAYATGDTFASDYLGTIKQSSSYSSTNNDILNKTLLGLIAQLNNSKDEKPVEVNLNIENFNGTQQNIDQLMKELNYLIQRSKKRF